MYIFDTAPVKLLNIIFHSREESVLSSKWTLFFSNMAELDACQVLNNCYIFNWTIHISLQEVPAIHPELIKPVKNVSS